MQGWKRAQRDMRPIIGYVAMPILVAFAIMTIVSQGWLAAPFVALGGAVLFFLWRDVHSGIFVSGSGVRVVRVVGTEVLPWDQLATVEVGGNGHPQILLRTISGVVIRTEVYRGFTGRRNDNWLRPKTFDRD